MSGLKCCGNCAFFFSNNEGVDAICALNPPLCVGMSGHPGLGTERPKQVYPRVSANTVCGSWQRMSWRDLPDDEIRGNDTGRPFNPDDWYFRG